MSALKTGRAYHVDDTAPSDRSGRAHIIHFGRGADLHAMRDLVEAR